MHRLLNLGNKQNDNALLIREHDDDGSGIIATLVGFSVLISIVFGIISLARLSSAQSRVGAVAQDCARLIAGLAFQDGQITMAQVLSQEVSDLGTLAPSSTFSSSNQGGLIIVKITTQVPILFALGSQYLSTTVAGDAAITQEVTP